MFGIIHTHTHTAHEHMGILDSTREITQNETNDNKFLILEMYC